MNWIRQLFTRVKPVKKYKITIESQAKLDTGERWFYVYVNGACINASLSIEAAERVVKIAKETIREEYQVKKVIYSEEI